MTMTLWLKVELETYTCGNCEFVLAENIIANTYDDTVYKYPSCESYNEIANK